MNSKQTIDNVLFLLFSFDWGNVAFAVIQILCLRNVVSSQFSTHTHTIELHIHYFLSKTNENRQPTRASAVSFQLIIVRHYISCADRRSIPAGSVGKHTQAVTHTHIPTTHLYTFIAFLQWQWVCSVVSFSDRRSFSNYSSPMGGWSDILYFFVRFFIDSDFISLHRRRRHHFCFFVSTRRARSIHSFPSIQRVSGGVFVQCVRNQFFYYVLLFSPHGSTRRYIFLFIEDPYTRLRNKELLNEWAEAFKSELWRITSPWQQ